MISIAAAAAAVPVGVVAVNEIASRGDDEDLSLTPAPSAAPQGVDMTKTISHGVVPPATVAAVDAVVDGEKDRLVDIFKGIHQNPELAFMEERTSKILADGLRKLGFEVKTGIGKTGVVGILRNGDGPTVAYRADMDANAVAEETGLDYASKVRVVRQDGAEVPVAHMCGHDAHVVWMLGMAQVLVELKDKWAGTAVLIGQPAEETITGAQAMIDDGLYDKMPKPEAIVILHTAPAPIGMMLSSPGTKLAGTDQLDVTFRGVGGHGSMPQLTKDPVLMAAMAITQYQAVVSRTVTPQETAVLTVGSVQGGADNNVIPESVTLKINTRWFSPAVRETLLKGIHAVSDGIARTYNVGDDLMPVYTEKGGSTPLVNSDALALSQAKMFRAILGEDKVITDFPPGMGSEDAHLLKGPHEDIELNYMFVGVADPEVYAQTRKAGKEMPYAHNPHYVVDLAAIPHGAKLASYAMFDLLGKK